MVVIIPTINSERIKRIKHVLIKSKLTQKKYRNTLMPFCQNNRLKKRLTRKMINRSPEFKSWEVSVEVRDDL